MLTNYQPISSGATVRPTRINRKRLLAAGAGVVAVAVCFMAYMPSNYANRFTVTPPKLDTKVSSIRSAMPFMEMNGAQPAGMVLHLPNPAAQPAPVSAMNIPSSLLAAGTSRMHTMSNVLDRPSVSIRSMRIHYSPYSALSRSSTGQLQSKLMSNAQSIRLPNEAPVAPVSAQTSASQVRSPTAQAFPQIVPPREYGNAPVAQTRQQFVTPPQNMYLPGLGRISNMNNENMNGQQGVIRQGSPLRPGMDSPSAISGPMNTLDRVLSGAI